jgi:streptogramin lyase
MEAISRDLLASLSSPSDFAFSPFRVFVPKKSSHLRCCPAFAFSLISALLSGGGPGGLMGTVAGTGAAGCAGDGGRAVAAQLNQPFGVVEDRDGDLFIADMGNQRIRRVDHRSHRITTVAGCGRKGDGGDGGPATAALLNEPYAVALDDRGDLFIVDRLNARVRRVDLKSGIIITVAGTGTPGYSGDGGPGDRAQLREPNGIAWHNGQLDIADVSDERVRRLDLKTGTITTVAGTGRRATEGDGGPAARAALNGPRAVAVDRGGDLFIVEREGNRVRRVDARSGIITTVAGTGARGYTGDGGPALQATFNGPKWICADRDGNLYVADTENHAIRRIDVRTGTIATVAGCGRRGPGGDGGPATAGELDRPHGCWVTRSRTLLIADTNNHRIRTLPLRAEAPPTGGAREPPGLFDCRAATLEPSITVPATHATSNSGCQCFLGALP